MTAAMVGTALVAASQTVDAVGQQKSIVATLFTIRREKEAALRRRLRWTADELGRKLDPLDDRWTAFGFNKPGAKQTPEVPVLEEVALVNDVAALARWSKAARADYYRVWLKVIGQSEVAVHGTAADLSFMIENLPSGIGCKPWRRKRAQ